MKKKDDYAFGKERNCDRGFSVSGLFEIQRIPSVYSGEKRIVVARSSWCAGYDRG